MYRIRNWNKFQHFKDRKPPWIKLHRDIMEQRDVMMLSPELFRFLILLWLLASEDKTKSGYLPSVADISYRLRISEQKTCDVLRQLDIFLISDRNQDGPPETETETETKEETEKDSKFSIADAEQVIAHYPKRSGCQGTGQPAKERIVAILESGNATKSDLIWAAEAYSIDCQPMKDRSGVQQCQTFFGPQKKTWAEYVSKGIDLRNATYARYRESDSSFIDKTDEEIEQIMAQRKREAENDPAC